MRYLLIQWCVTFDIPYDNTIHKELFLEDPIGGRKIIDLYRPSLLSPEHSEKEREREGVLLLILSLFDNSAIKVTRRHCAQLALAELNYAISIASRAHVPPRLSLKWTKR